MNDITALTLIAKIKKQTESFDTVVLKEVEAKALVESLEKAQTELERYRTAFHEWGDKTEWVQKDKRFDVLKPWGKHRADVLKEYIEHLESRTVKLPPRVDSSNVPFTAHTWNCCLDAVEKCLTAAGIQVIEGER